MRTQDDTRIADSVQEFADAFGVSRSTIYSEMAAGRITYFKVGARRLIPRASRDEYLRARLDAAACDRKAS